MRRPRSSLSGAKRRLISQRGSTWQGAEVPAAKCGTAAATNPVCSPHPPSRPARRTHPHLTKCGGRSCGQASANNHMFQVQCSEITKSTTVCGDLTRTTVWKYIELLINVYPTRAKCTGASAEVNLLRKEMAGRGGRVWSVLSHDRQMIRLTLKIILNGVQSSTRKGVTCLVEHLTHRTFGLEGALKDYLLLHPPNI